MARVTKDLILSVVIQKKQGPLSEIKTLQLIVLPAEESEKLIVSHRVQYMHPYKYPV